MPDLRDGESVFVQGSASRPYQLKNVAGVYSCTCPAWRNQSLPIDRRTCKHLRSHRGDLEEEKRIGSLLPTPKNSKPAKRPPPLLLAESWDASHDPTGWWLSEKLDGVRAFWDGQRLLSRQGNQFHAPTWFTEGLPLEPLDGELWLGRKQFQRTVSIVRRQDGNDLWRDIRYRIFDAPAHDTVFEKRLDLVRLIIDMHRPAFAQMHDHLRCEGAKHLHHELERVQGLGGEGLMLRQPRSLYTVGRSTSLLKVKTFHEAEALVIGHEPGAGRHRGRLGALLVEMTNGIRFAVGTGFTDAQRERPPSIGSWITFSYQELTNGGVPRFPAFVRVRNDINIPVNGEISMSSAVSSTQTRRFEFVEGSSDKFWSVTVQGYEVHIQFGRNGTHGQSVVKSFTDTASAIKHAEKLIQEKTAKGYLEVGQAA